MSIYRGAVRRSAGEHILLEALGKDHVYSNAVLVRKGRSVSVIAGHMG